jgi:PAS domain S-box-containing protein
MPSIKKSPYEPGVAPETEVLFETLMAALTVGVAFLDPELRFLRVSAKWADFEGRPADDYPGRTLQEVDPEWHRLLEPSLRQTLTSGQPFPRHEVTKPSVFHEKGLREYSVSLVPLRLSNGDVAGLALMAEDVTERKRAEQSVKESEARFRALTENSSDMYTLLDCDGTVLYSSPSVHRLLGYSYGEYRGRKAAEFIHPDDLPFVAGKLRDLLQRPGETESAQYRVRHKDGSWRWVDSIGANLLHDDYVRAIVVNYWDITERKQMEERLRSIMRHARCILWIGDVTMRDGLPLWKGDVLDVEAAQQVLPLDVPPGSSYTGVWYRHRHPEDRVRTEAFSYDALMDGLAHYTQEFRSTDRNGVEHWLYEIVSLQTLDEGHWQAVGAAMDITELKIAEEALQRRNDQLQLLTETSERLLQEEDPQPLVERLFERLSSGWKLDAYLFYLVTEDGRGLSLASYRGISEETAHSIRSFNFDEAGEPPREGDKSGTEEGIELGLPMAEWGDALGLKAFVSQPLIGNEMFIGTLAFGARERAPFDEDELEILETLANQVALSIERSRLVKELRQRTQALKTADENKDQFLAMLAHELRNPLAPLLNGLYLLEHRGDDPATRARVHDVMNRQVKHMAQLVNDLLDVSRIARGKIELRPQKIALLSLVKESLEDHRPDFEKKRIHLSLDAPDQPVFVEGDYTRLYQVLGNLLGNALKFTDPEGCVTVGIRMDGGEARVWVTDTGVGVDPALLPTLFETFMQADQALDRNRGGLGLGLALVKGIVELHGGRTRAFSEGVGKGTELSFWLPLSTPAPAKKPLPKDSLETSSRRILVIEDNADTAESLKETLELSGHVVEMASTGKEGVAAARRFRPEVVLCDIGLPEMDGYEVAAALRQEPSTRGVALIGITGYGQEEDKHRSQEAGIDLHLTKPVDPEELLRYLNGLLRTEESETP